MVQQGCKERVAPRTRECWEVWGVPAHIVEHKGSLVIWLHVAGRQGTASCSVKTAAAGDTHAKLFTMEGSVCGTVCCMSERDAKQPAVACIRCMTCPMSTCQHPICQSRPT